jgi:hypothetical protein
VFFLLVALTLTMGLWPVDPVSANQKTSYGRTNPQRVPLSCPEVIPKIDNLCEVSRVRDDQRPEFTRKAGSRLSAVIDGDRSTYLTKGETAGEWLEIRFPGAPKWVNVVEIEYRGDDPFELMLFDSEGAPRKIAVISTDFRHATESREIVTIEFEPARAKGIRWSFGAVGVGGGGIDISEISASFLQTDPDPNDPTNWLLCETGDAVIGPPDLSPMWDKIRGLPAWCPSAPHGCHCWVSPADWAADFKRAAAGGAENSHALGYTGMDYHDLSVIANHGSPGAIYFTTGPSPATSVLRPAHIWHAWGDRDAEWFCALSCSPYAWDPPNNWPWKWANGFNGLHLQCGFTTTAWATGGAFLGGFANLMVSDGLWDPALPIAKSWFLAKNTWMTPVAPEPVCAIVLADDSEAYRDHLWGEGYVSPDPSPPRGGVWAMYDPPFSDAESRFTQYPPPLTTRQLKSISEITSAPSSRTVAARSSIGVPVKMAGDLLTMDVPDYMWVYDIDPLNVDSSFIAGVASDLCGSGVGFCNPEIGQDGQADWWVTQDEHALWGDHEHGFIQYVNIDEYMTPKDSAATQLPDPPTLFTAADVLLMGLGLKPDPYTYTQALSFNNQAVYDLDTETLLEDSTFTVSINVDYYRRARNYPVFGPGGYIGVTFDEDLDLHHFTHGAWHDLGDSTWESLIGVATAIDQLATIGEEATIGGIPPLCDSLLIDSVEVAYYNTNGEYETDILEPIYHFWCYCQSEYDTVAQDVFVPALHPTPHGMIIEPMDGDTLDAYEDVQLIGAAVGGTPPYTFTWVSVPLDSILHTASGVAYADTCVATDMPPVFKGDSLTYHHVSLTVVDADGMECSDAVALFLVCDAGIEDGGGEGIPRAFCLAQNRPNPFKPVTEIKYDLPVGCHVKLEIYNILGQRVATLVDGRQSAGYKAVRWDSRNIAGARTSPGIYFCRLQAGSFVATRKMVLLD